MKCLNCHSMMKEITSDGIAYELCIMCGSAWLDRGELQHLLKREAPEWDDDMIRARLELPQQCRWCDTLYPPFTKRCEPCNRPLDHLCPRDNEPMYIVSEGDLKLDVCSCLRVVGSAVALRWGFPVVAGK